MLSFMLLYRLGDIMMFAMSKPLLHDLGVNQVQRGMLNGAGGIASILGTIVAGRSSRARAWRAAWCR